MGSRADRPSRPKQRAKVLALSVLSLGIALASLTYIGTVPRPGTEQLWLSAPPAAPFAAAIGTVHPSDARNDTAARKTKTMLKAEIRAAKFTGEKFCTCPETRPDGRGSLEPICVNTTKNHTLEYARQAVRAVCGMRQEVMLMRERVNCQLRAFENVWDASASATTAEEVPGEGRSCQNITVKQPGEYKDPELSKWKLQQRLKIIEALPAVASISAVKPLLWAAGNTSELFYTRRNMWELRRDHPDPFTNETAKYLPPELPNIHMPTCAIVGNSGVLKKHNPPLGKKIDEATVVIRVNQGPASERYQPYVGSRTNIRVLNKSWTESYATKLSSLLAKADAGGMIIASRATTKYFEKLGEKILSNTTDNKMYLLTNHNLVGYGLRLLRAFRNGLEQGLGTEYKGGDSPSSGFLAILLTLQMCGSVSIYGFSMGGCDGSCGKYHYFSDVPDNYRSSAYRGHTYANEGWLIKAMHIQGLACIEPAPQGLGPCGGRLGRRITRAGVPSHPFGGPRWRQISKLVTAVSNDKRYGNAMVHSSRRRQPPSQSRSSPASRSSGDL